MHDQVWPYFRFNVQRRNVRFPPLADVRRELVLPDVNHYCRQISICHYDGMTVNERRFSAGLMEAFDAATARRDRDTLIAILVEVSVVDPETTADAVLIAPPRDVR